MCHLDLDESDGDVAVVLVLELFGDRDFGGLAGRGGPVRILGVYQCESDVEVQFVDDVGLALMDVHGAGMNCGRSAARVDSAQHPAGFTVDNGHLSSDAAANVQRAVGVRIGGDEPSVRSEEHPSELQSLMRISYDLFCLKKKKK